MRLHVPDVLITITSDESWEFIRHSLLHNRPLVSAELVITLLEIDYNIQQGRKPEHKATLNHKESSRD